MILAYESFTKEVLVRHLKEWLILLMGGTVYLISALAWEVAIVRITIWWGEQLIAVRPSLTGYEPMGYVTVALFFMLVVIPNFMWFPVLLFKELKELWDEQPCIACPLA